MTDFSEDSACTMNFENIPEMEDEWRNEIAEMTVLLQERRKPGQGGEVLRGVHPKSHGCLDAEFHVNDDLDCDLRVGLFAQPGRCFGAKLRYSNADVLKRPDVEKSVDEDGNTVVKHGSRGVGLKVLDVDGPVLLRDAEACNQDFLMINTPQFAFRNVRDYRRLTQALLAAEDAADPKLFFLPFELFQRGIVDGSGQVLPAPAGEPAENTALRNLFLSLGMFADYTPQDMAGMFAALKVVDKIQSSVVRNPLDAPYFTASPFRFGPDRVARFAIKPLGEMAPPAEFSAEEIETLPDDYLAQAVADRVAQGAEITLAFRVQIAGAADIEGKIDDMIEDASQAWDEGRFPFVDVARIVIRPCGQREDLVDACKPLLFTPWHALAAHEPLGGINRLRKPVYSGSAAFRRSAAASPQPAC